MIFLRRSLVGLFLLSLTIGLLATATSIFLSAVEARRSQEPGTRPARERLVAVNTVAVQFGTEVPSLTAFGEIKSRRTLEIRTGVGGRVVALADSFDDGAAVTDGTLLAQIDPTDAESAVEVARTDLAEAATGLRDAERALSLARDELAAAEAQADLRSTALTRQEDLQRRGVGTAAAVETAALAAASADQAVLTRRIAEAGAETRLEQAGNTLARRQIALANAERGLADTRIIAAFDGTLSEVAVVAGGIVTANERIATLIDPRALEVAFRLSTAAYARLLDESGDLIAAPITVSLDVLGLDLQTPGQITRVSAEVGEGQTGRRLFAQLDSHAGFRPGDFVTVRIEEPALDNVARLPATAVNSAGTVLAIGADDKLDTVPVNILRRQGDDVLIRAAALDGRRVVAELSPLVGPGIRVRDLTLERAEAQTAAAAPVADSPPQEETRIALTADRRAALIAAVEGNRRMPADAKARVLAALQQDTVPARMVERIEARMGG